MCFLLFIDGRFQFAILCERKYEFPLDTIRFFKQKDWKAEYSIMKMANTLNSALAGVMANISVTFAFLYSLTFSLPVYHKCEKGV